MRSLFDVEFRSLSAMNEPDRLTVQTLVGSSERTLNLTTCIVPPASLVQDTATILYSQRLVC